MIIPLIKNRYHLNIFISTIVILFLSGCSVFYSKDNYINDFKVFVDSVEKDYRGYTEADWAEKDKIYLKYSVEYYEKYKDKLTEEDKYVLGKIKGSYNMLKLKKEAKDIIDQTKDVLDQTKGFIDGAVEKLNK
jgi:hypothetical protein